MKDISDIELEIDELSERLKSISMELKTASAENMTKPNNNFSFDNIILQARSHPIKGHPVTVADEYSQKLYFIMLLSMLQIDKEAIEEKLRFVCRIIYSGNSNLDILEIEKQSLKINDKVIDEFIDIWAENDLRINFAVDMLLMANMCEKCSNTLIEYIANLFDIIGLSKDEIKFAVNMSKAVVLQDESLYEDILIDPIMPVDLKKFKMYTANISKGRYKNYIVEDSADKIVVRSKNPVVYNCNLKELLKNKNDIFFENIIVNINKSITLNFKDFLNITFKNCKFIGDGKRRYIILNFDKGNCIDIENCEFNNVKTPRQENGTSRLFFICGAKSLICVNRVKKIIVINNKIIKCDVSGADEAENYESHIENHNSIINIDRNESKLVNVKNNEFIACKVTNHI